jgi:hypothetical protein
MNAGFRVEFRGEAPDTLKVGDRLKLAGEVFVKSIDADAIEITGYGDPGMEYALGDLTISLLSTA